MLSTTQAAPTLNHGAINCYIRQVKLVNKLEADFPEHQHAEEEDCETFVEEISKVTYTKIALTMRRNTEMSNQTKCIMADLRANHWVEDIMLHTVLDSMPGDEYKQRAADVEGNAEKAIRHAVNMCLFDVEFGEMFDQFMESTDSSEEEDSAMMEYCARKQVAENNLIDTTAYTIELNPKNLDVAAADCEEILKKELDDFRKRMVARLRDENGIGFNDEQVDCAMKKYQQGKYFSKLLAIGVLSEQNLTDEQKATERKTFVEAMRGLVNIAGDCA